MWLKFLQSTALLDCHFAFFHVFSNAQFEMINLKVNTMPLPDPNDIVQVLTQALPYIQRFSGQICVVKYGGNAMTEEELKNSFARDVVLLKLVGMQPVVVHGGGPQIGQCLEALKLGTEFINGIRVTDKRTMEVVEMVLGGKVNKEIVQLIQQHNGTAVGITGVDGHTIQAEKLISTDGVDYGYVGKVTKIDTQLIHKLLSNNIIPVIAPVGAGQNGERFNINADTAASHIAAALKASKLLILTNTRGVLDKKMELIQRVNQQQVNDLIADGTISGGMLPKIECALNAIKQGVNSVQIIDGRVQHALLLELFTERGFGTQILP